MSDDASRRRPISIAQWRAARAISECEMPTRDRVAAILGCNVRSVFARAAAEDWQAPDWRRPAAKSAHHRFRQIVFGGDADGFGPHVDRSSESSDSDHEEAGDDAMSRTGTKAPESGGAAGMADPTEAGNDDPLEMLSRGVRFMSRQLAKLIRDAERGGRINKQDIDNLIAMTRMMGRWEALAKERAREQETDRDAKIAEAYRKIDRRILQLARAEAERLVAAGYRSGDSD